jgi:tRNA (cytidine/uridine-2'-O-)-methyltransferase
VKNGEAEDLKNHGTGNSLSRESRAPQPSGSDPADSPLANYSAHVVLYQPEIPQNTGNVGRTCVAVGAKLWIVRPAGFRFDDARIRRAGLDYWEHLALGDAANWDDLIEQLSSQRLFFFSRFAKRTLWDAKLERGDVFVFGRESSGLPKSILDPEDPRALRLPTTPHVRSLNLGTTVGVVLYEQQRQIRQSDAVESSGRSSES